MLNLLAFVVSLLVPNLVIGQTVFFLGLGESVYREDGSFDGAYFSAFLEGTGFGSAALLTPDLLIVPLFSFETGVFETEIEFTSVANRQQLFPPGTYQLLLDGVFGSAVTFSPVVPNGFASITFPSNGQVGVPLDPIFTFANGCTNCFTSFPGSTGPSELELGLYTLESASVDEFASISASSTSHNFGVTLAPAEDHLFEIAVFNASLDDSGPFDFGQFSEEVNSVWFIPGVTGVASGICGDLDGNYVLSSEDVLRYRTALADPSGAGLTPSEQARCAVIGPPACDIRQVVVMRRVLHDKGLLPDIEEICDDAPPSLIGTYSGSETADVVGCQDTDDNGTFMLATTLTVSAQDDYGQFEGTGTASVGSFSENTFYRGLVWSDGSVFGEFRSESTFGGAFDSHSAGIFSGFLAGGTLSMETFSDVVIGDTCNAFRSVTLARQ